jgi:hypothetical protein
LRLHGCKTPFGVGWACFFTACSGKTLARDERAGAERLAEGIAAAGLADVRAVEGDPPGEATSNLANARRAAQAFFLRGGHASRRLWGKTTPAGRVT